MADNHPSEYLASGGELPLSNAVQLDLLQTFMERGVALRTRVHGASMSPLVRDGDVVTVVPMAGRDPRLGEVVACLLPETGRLVFHRIVARHGAGWVLRGDNSSESDGTVAREAILGSITRVERNGRGVAFGSGFAGSGTAWLSRIGMLRTLDLPRRLVRRAASQARQGLQSTRIYRSIGRNLGRRFSVTEAGRDDAREALAIVGRMEASLPPPGAPGSVVTSWVAKHDKAVVGSVELRAVEGPHPGYAGDWVSSLWVKGRYRGLGLGETLLTRAVEAAAARSRAELRLAVFVDNRIALRLFDKLGFAETRVEALEASLDAEQELARRRRVVLVKPLGPRAE